MGGFQRGWGGKGRRFDPKAGKIQPMLTTKAKWTPTKEVWGSTSTFTKEATSIVATKKHFDLFTAESTEIAE